MSVHVYVDSSAAYLDRRNIRSWLSHPVRHLLPFSSFEKKNQQKCFYYSCHVSICLPVSVEQNENQILIKICWEVPLKSVDTLLQVSLTQKIVREIVHFWVLISYKSLKLCRIRKWIQKSIIGQDCKWRITQRGTQKLRMCSSLSKAKRCHGAYVKEFYTRHETYSLLRTDFHSTYKKVYS
jgi:hypothetical protein